MLTKDFQGLPNFATARTRVQRMFTTIALGNAADMTDELVFVGEWRGRGWSSALVIVLRFIVAIVARPAVAVYRRH